MSELIDPLTQKVLPNKRDVRMGLVWRGKNFKIGSASWSMKGLFVFRSTFHQECKTPILWGYANLKEQKFKLAEADTKSYQNDLHVTLHPPDKSHDGKMHVRSTGAEILEQNRRSIDWFPVNKPFNLFHFYTPPMDTLTPCKEKLDFTVPVPDDRSSSVVVRVDILPPKTAVMAAPGSLIAYTPHFIAVLAFFVSPDRLSATIIWPASSELSLD
jgi:hypothetical protein